MQEKKANFSWLLIHSRQKPLHSKPGSGNTLEEGMATHSSILAWRIPWTEEPGGLQSIGSQRAGHDWGDSAHTLPTQIENEFDLFQKRKPKMEEKELPTFSHIRVTYPTVLSPSVPRYRFPAPIATPWGRQVPFGNLEGKTLRASSPDEGLTWKSPNWEWLPTSSKAPKWLCQFVNQIQVHTSHQARQVNQELLST